MSYFDDVIEPSLYEPPMAKPMRQGREQALIRELRSGVWHSAHGAIPICSMSDGHLRNALSLVTRRDRDEVDRVAGEVLRAELSRRSKGGAKE